MKHQIIVCTNHKTGTQLFKQIFKQYCKTESKNFSQTHSSNPKLCLFLNHSRDFKMPRTEYKGIHIYRHPYEIIMSGVRYHQITSETWCAKKKKFPGPSGIKETYQQRIRRLDMDDKIMFEMEHSAKNTIMSIYNWDRTDKNFKMIKLEDVNENTTEIANEIAAFLDLKIPKFTKIFEKNVRKMRTAKHTTNKSGSLYTFQKHFKAKHYERFKELFPLDLFEKLGYE